MTKLPNGLISKGWDCPEATELNLWTKVLLDYEREHNIFDQALIASLKKSLLELMSGIVQLRHDTVHRVHHTADKVLEYVDDARQLVILLENDAANKVMADIQCHVKSALTEMQRNKDMLEFSMKHTKENHAAALEELNRKRDEALSNAMAEDKDFDHWTGTNLLQNVARVVGLRHL
jgi:hypothetical protein